MFYVSCLCNCICGCLVCLLVLCMLMGVGICVLEYYSEVIEVMFVYIFGVCVLVLLLLVWVYGLFLVVIDDFDLVIFFELIWFYWMNL